MPNFNQFLIFESENAYDFAYDLSMKRNYSVPKIYTANGDLKKRWYVYFSYRNPKTGKLKRVTPFYGEANKYKTKEDRLFVLSAYRKKILELLKKGYNPFEDNIELYQKQQEIAKSKTVATQPTGPFVPTENPVVDNHSNVATHQKTIKEAFDFALTLKKNLVSNTTYNSYNSRSKAFQIFVAKNFPNVTYINQLTKNMVVEFLNGILLKNSARSRNNCRIDLGSLLQTLEDNEIIVSNFIKNIPV